MDPEIQEMLAQLRDAHAPELGAAWWPPAPGWWILAALLLAATLTLVYQRYRQHQLTAYKKQALALLEEARQELQLQGDNARFLSRCSAILRRVLLYRLGRALVAHLTGW